MSGAIIPLNNKNSNQSEKADADDAKNMMMEMAVETFMNDPAMNGMKNKFGGVLKLIAKPAFRQFLKMLGNDETRFMVYVDYETGDIVIHKFKIKPDTSEEPKEGSGEMKVTAPDGRKIMIHPNGTWREVAFNEPDSSVILEFKYTPEEEGDILLRVNEKDLENTDELIKHVIAKFGGVKMGF